MTQDNSTPMSRPAAAPPRNGWAGLRHWQHDLLAGLLVAMVSTPFSIGIAIASGAPPITGLTSAIIAGFVLPFLGGSYVTISGPAAGLAPILLTAMLTLGQGSTAAGYPLLLPLICMVGVLQIILCRLKVARYCSVFPSPVVEGMLAAIGLMIIAKQLPVLLGHAYSAHEFWGILGETPKELLRLNPAVFGLGLLTLGTIGLLVALGKNAQWQRWAPPQMVAVALGTLVAAVFFRLEPTYFVQIPDNPLAHAITWPDFSGLWAQPQLWWSALGIVITLTLVDGIESLATITAVDKIDPFKRQSDPDRTLLAMGVSNICSSLLGGLTIIPGGVKSTACIMAGGRTQWANFYNACFLLMFLLLFHQQISAFPLSVLAAVLIYTGYKLCRPKVWVATSETGMGQLFLFTSTVLLTLSTDLLWGILGGVALTLLLNVGYHFRAARYLRDTSAAGGPAAWVQRLLALFQNPVAKVSHHGDTWHVFLNKPLVCFNYLPLSQQLRRIPDSAQQIFLHVTDQVTLIDHTVMDNIHLWTRQRSVHQHTSVTWEGLEGMKKLAASPLATRVLDVPPADALAPSTSRI